MGEEAGRVNGRPVDLLSFEQVMDLGTNSVLDSIERGVEDSAEWLDGDMGMSADRLGEGQSEEVQTVDKVWVITIPSDAIIIWCSLVLIRAVHGDSSGITGKGGGREIGHHAVVDNQS